MSCSHETDEHFPCFVHHIRLISARRLLMTVAQRLRSCVRMHSWIRIRMNYNLYSYLGSRASATYRYFFHNDGSFTVQLAKTIKRLAEAVVVAVSLVAAVVIFNCAAFPSLDAHAHKYHRYSYGVCDIMALCVCGKIIRRAISICHRHEFAPATPPPLRLTIPTL